MITILYTIVFSTLTLFKGERETNKRVAITVCELIIAICLGVGYGFWIAHSIVQAHIVDPQGIIAFLVAQETVVSSCLVALRTAVYSVVNRSKSKDGSKEPPEDGTTTDDSVSE